MSPLISIIIPLYNSERYIGECLDSLIGQTYKNWEAVIVNDGSTDSSAEICGKYASEDSRIYLFNQKNNGQASARNTALRHIKGRYICFLDSDDYISTDTLLECISAISQSDEISFVQFPLEKNGITNKPDKTIGITTHDEAFRLWLDKELITNYVCDKLWKKEMFDGLWFPEKMIFEDRYLIPELLSRSKTIRIITGGKYFYRTHPTQTTQRKRDIFFLTSQITADLNIISYLKKHSFVYFKIWNRAYSNYIELSQQHADPEISKKIHDTKPGLYNLIRHSMQHRYFPGKRAILTNISSRLLSEK